MKIRDSFGTGGSFTEYYAVDYYGDVVLMGHDGPGHIAIAEGKTKVRPLDVFHGKVGRGLSVEMSVKHGPVTLLSVVQTADGKLDLLVAEGESVAGPFSKSATLTANTAFRLGQALSQRMERGWTGSSLCRGSSERQIFQVSPWFKGSHLLSQCETPCARSAQVDTSAAEVQPSPPSAL